MSSLKLPGMVHGNAHHPEKSHQQQPGSPAPGHVFWQHACHGENGGAVLNGPGQTLHQRVERRDIREQPPENPGNLDLRPAVDFLPRALQSEEPGEEDRFYEGEQRKPEGAGPKIDLIQGAALEAKIGICAPTKTRVEVTSTDFRWLHCSSSSRKVMSGCMSLS